MPVYLFFEGGLVALIVFAVVTTVVTTRLWRRVSSGDSFALMVAASLAGTFFVGLFDSILDDPRIAFLAFVLIWLALVEPATRLDTYNYSRRHLFAGVAAFWFRARSKRDTFVQGEISTTHRNVTADGEGELTSYYSDFSETSLSIDEHTRSVILASNRRPDVHLPYARVTSCEIHVNGDQIKHISHHASPLTAEEGNGLLRTLRALKAEPLRSEDERKIDLVIDYKDSRSGVHVVTFYCRIGNRRVTPKPLEDSSRDVLEWLQYLDAEVFTPLEGSDTGAPESGRGETQADNSLRRDPVSIAAELEKIADLKARGMLTDEEFQKAKSRLLD